jgi:hypothetical protein
MRHSFDILMTPFFRSSGTMYGQFLIGKAWVPMAMPPNLKHNAILHNGTAVHAASIIAA